MTPHVLRHLYDTPEEEAAHARYLAEVDAGLAWTRAQLGLPPLVVQETVVQETLL